MPTNTLQASELRKYSEQSMIVAIKHGQLSWDLFLGEIKLRMAAGEHVHPYHAACAEVA